MNKTFIKIKQFVRFSFNLVQVTIVTRVKLHMYKYEVILMICIFMTYKRYWYNLNLNKPFKNYYVVNNNH